jgi:hypothetical protein
VKNVQPPIIVSLCLETQRRIAWSRARTAPPDSTPRHPVRRAPDAIAHPPGDSSAKGS